MELKKRIGSYSIYKKKISNKYKFIVDNGKTIFLKRFKKYVINPNHVLVEFDDLKSAEDFIKKKQQKNKIITDKIKNNISKSLYLILIREESTNKLFVKVGITSKRFIIRRFSKSYGYNGYTVETILRRIDGINAAELEKQIKDNLNKNKSVKKYRPVLENFSGYSECYDFICLDSIIVIFDSFVAKY